MFDLHIVKKDQQQTSSWMAGTTTQIAIYPKDSDYTDRNFLWRLSTAVVELEESSFTQLPGFDRHLMVLEGALELVHKDQYSVILKQYEQDHFKGGWDTVSLGKARDFNLMLKEGVRGRVEQRNTSAGQRFEIKLKAAGQKQSFYTCYCYKGQINLEAGGQLAALAEGDLLLIGYHDDLWVAAENNGNAECSLIAAFIEI
ncbi:MAG TPA: HutD family protein [Patescibacteria group bacterium]|nr:HutD family protein [Patescibacteria group bacterium]